MTRREAIRRAEEWLSKETNGRSDDNCNHPTYKFAIRCYMQCYNDMTEGQPDGYVCLTKENQFPISISDTSPDFAWVAAERLSGMSESDLKSSLYVVRPVKLLVLEDKTND